MVRAGWAPAVRARVESVKMAGMVFMILRADIHWYDTGGGKLLEEKERGIARGT
jgi:hypothetical protein